MVDGPAIGRWGQDSDSYKILVSGSEVYRHRFQIAGLTSTGILELYTVEPPSDAYRAPVWVMGGLSTIQSGGTADVTVLNSAGKFGTIDINLAKIGGTTLSGANVVDTGNNAIRVNQVAGGAASGTANPLSVGVVFPFDGQVIDPRLVTVLNSVGVAQSGTWNVNQLTSILSSVGVSATIVSPLDTELKQLVVTQGSGGSLGSPWFVRGSKNTNQISPDGTGFQVLPSRAQANAPSFTEGNLVLLSSDLAGNLRVISPASAGVSAIIVGQPVSVDLKNVSVTSAGGMTTLAQSTSAGGLVRLAMDFGSIMARIKNKQFMDNEEVRYDIPTLLANGASYVGLSSSGAATASNAWHIVRTDYDANANPNRDRIKFHSWDNRTAGW